MKEIRWKIKPLKPWTLFITRQGFHLVYFMKMGHCAILKVDMQFENMNKCLKDGQEVLAIGQVWLLNVSIHSNVRDALSIDRCTHSKGWWCTEPLDSPIMDDNANKRMLSPERGSSDMKMRSEGQGLFIPKAVAYPRGHRGAPTPFSPHLNLAYLYLRWWWMQWVQEVTLS